MKNVESCSVIKNLLKVFDFIDFNLNCYYDFLLYGKMIDSNAEHTENMSCIVLVKRQ